MSKRNITLRLMATAIAVDRNGNGRIDRDEFIRATEQYLQYRKVTAAAFPFLVNDEEILLLKSVSAAELERSFKSKIRNFDNPLLAPNGIEPLTFGDFELLAMKNKLAAHELEENKTGKGLGYRLSSLLPWAGLRAEIGLEITSKIPDAIQRKSYLEKQVRGR